MKSIALGLFVCCAALPVLAAEPAWLTDLPKAQAQAKTEKKAVLMDFTGSDWCGWCIKIKKEVLTTPEFADYARKSLVLVELDFPSAKITQSAELKKANKALQSKFGVKGFPTFVLVDGDGKELGRQVGYLKGGAQAFIDKLKSFQK